MGSTKASRPDENESALAHGVQRAGELAPLLPATLPTPDTTKPQRSVIVSVCSFILATEFCVCLAGATLTGSLPIFFRKRMGLDNVLSTELNNVLLSLSNLTPIVGAYLADKHFGRFHTIGISSIVYLLGLALCTLAATPRFASLPLFMVGLYGGVAFGGGGIKPNVVVLGADQFNTDIPAQRREKASFFNWFYWSINIGSFLSYSVLSNVAVNGAPPLVPEELGFAVAFGCATLAFFIGVAVFYSGQSRYRRLPPKGSALGDFFSVLLEAGRRTAKGKLVLTACAAFLPGIVLTTLSYFVTTSPRHMALALAGASSVVFATVVLIVTGTSTTWLTLAARRHGGTHSVSHVEDVRQVMRLMPYLSIMIIFWAAFGQMKSNFLLQGCQMDLPHSHDRDLGAPDDGLVSHAERAQLGLNLGVHPRVRSRRVSSCDATRHLPVASPKDGHGIGGRGVCDAVCGSTGAGAQAPRCCRRRLLQLCEWKRSAADGRSQRLVADASVPSHRCQRDPDEHHIVRSLLLRGSRVDA
ncbi:hypothetical protein PINS_up005850 [Pythium insidiosum]|nr:hypothetical protein PINS_up005850 [Pythium insidiosum]